MENRQNCPLPPPSMPRSGAAAATAGACPPCAMERREGAPAQRPKAIENALAVSLATASVPKKEKKNHRGPGENRVAEAQAARPGKHRHASLAVPQQASPTRSREEHHRRPRAPNTTGNFFNRVTKGSGKRKRFPHAQSRPNQSAHNAKAHPTTSPTPSW